MFHPRLEDSPPRVGLGGVVDSTLEAEEAEEAEEEAGVAADIAAVTQTRTQAAIGRWRSAWGSEWDISLHRDELDRMSSSTPMVILFYTVR